MEYTDEYADFLTVSGRIKPDDNGVSIAKKALIHRALGIFADVTGGVFGRCEMA